MNEQTNTPTVENEQTNNTPTVKVEKKKEALFLAPKSQKGKKGTVGTPAKPIIGLTKNPCRGRFTLSDIFALNGGTVSKLTIINCMFGTESRTGLVEAGTVTKLKEKSKTKGKPGKPADVFIFTKNLEKKHKNGAPTGENVPTITVDTAPVVNANPEPAPVVEAETHAEPTPEPAHVEQVAEAVL